jgi:glutamate-1-semialdehyde aminotransferase
MNVHFSSEKVVDLRTARADWSSSLPLRDLLNLALKNHGVYTPRRVMFSISSPMNDREIEKTMKAFEDSLDQLKLVIGRKCPKFLL